MTRKQARYFAIEMISGVADHDFLVAFTKPSERDAWVRKNDFTNPETMGWRLDIVGKERTMFSDKDPTNHDYHLLQEQGALDNEGNLVGTAPMPTLSVAHIKLAWESLPPREQDLVKMKYGFDGTPTKSTYQIARQFGVTEDRIKRLIRRALWRLAERNVNLYMVHKLLPASPHHPPLPASGEPSPDVRG